MGAAGSITGAPARARATRARAARRPGRVALLLRTALCFLAPAALFFLVLIAYPLLRVLWLSLHYADLVNPTVSGFAGLDNYRTVLGDDEFLSSLWHTAEWTLLSVAGEYALGLVAALALAQPVRFRGLFRAIVIIPWLIPIVVAGLDWSWMLAPEYGVLNLWLVKLGILDKPFYFLGGMQSALLTVTFVNIWRSFPFYAVSLLAALQAVPRELHEAAAIDGAGTWRRFRSITLPHLRGVSLTLILLHVVWTAINFDFIWVMTQGGPLAASQTLPIMIYRYALQQFDVGAACALASMMLGFMAAAFFVYYYAAQRRRSAIPW
jgi:multiple sugar transport system permease protein